MADVTASQADVDFITRENVTRDGGAAWSEGLGLVRSDTADPFKVAVNSVNGGRISGVIPEGYEAQPDTGRASMWQSGRYPVKIQDSETLAMHSPLACNASGKFRLATVNDWVVATSLAVVSGTSQTGVVQLIPYWAQYKLIPETIGFAAAAGASNICEVTITVQNAIGGTLAGVFNLDVWLSDASTGAGLTGTSASGTVQVKSASGADLEVMTAKKAIRVQTLATGIYTLEITDSAKTAFYPCASLPNGAAQVGTVLATGDYG